jgi:hypothetical protein
MLMYPRIRVIRHDVAVSQNFDIAERRLAEESAGSVLIPMNSWQSGERQTEEL